MSQGKPQTSYKLQRVSTVTLMGPRAQSFPPAELLRESFLIGVDGGVWASHQDRYDLTVGDGDSVAPGITLMERYPVAKDLSDLALALELIPPHIDTLHLWGFWGGRDDHHLINLGEVFFLNHAPAVTLIHRFEGSPVRLLNPGSHTLKLSGTFSLISLVPALFSLSGACRFPIENLLVRPFSSQLLSNHAEGEVTIHCDQRFFCLEEQG